MVKRIELNSYVEETYGQGFPICQKVLKGYTPLLQSEYGGTMDCVLTTITTLYHGDEDVDDFYDKVEQNALNYFYNSDRGTALAFISPIVKASTGKKCFMRPFKWIGFNWNKIKSLVDQYIPLILTMKNDGRNYYKNHTVAIIGYIEYDNGAKMLVVYDNWYRGMSYIDYNKLSFISGINYI